MWDFINLRIDATSPTSLISGVRICRQTSHSRIIGQPSRFHFFSPALHCLEVTRLRFQGRAMNTAIFTGDVRTHKYSIKGLQQSQNKEPSLLDTLNVCLGQLGSGDRASTSGTWAKLPGPSCQLTRQELSRLNPRLLPTFPPSTNYHE